MTGRDNADAKWDGDKIEGEDSLRTMNCLRERLFAERLASRNAKAEAEQLGNKLLELEGQLKEETKSRNRAEKKLKFLVKILESMNISCSGHAVLLDKCDISSVSSRASSRTNQLVKSENLQVNISKKHRSQGSKVIVESQKESANLQANDSQLSLWSLNHDSCTTEGSSTSSSEVNLPQLQCQECEMGSNENSIFLKVEDCLSSAGAPHPERPSQLISNQMHNDSRTNEQRMESSSQENGLNQEDNQDPDNDVDNSMALVSVEMPKKERIDLEVFDATVKEVLELFRHAKEQLQNSMEKRRISMNMSIIKVG